MSDQLDKRVPTLTKRERETMTLLSTGATQKSIGDAMGISERCVKFHLRNIYRKLGVHSNIMAVVRYQSTCPNGQLGGKRRGA